MVTTSRVHPKFITADILAYPNTSFGYLTTSALGRLIAMAAGPRAEQSIVSKRPLRLGSATVAHPGLLPYQYIIHYVIYPGVDRRWYPHIVEVALQNTVRVADSLDARTGVMMLPVHPPVDPRYWPAICRVTAAVLRTDTARDWTVLLGDANLEPIWAAEWEALEHAERVSVATVAVGAEPEGPDVVRVVPEAGAREAKATGAVPKSETMAGGAKGAVPKSGGTAAKGTVAKGTAAKSGQQKH